MEATSHRRGAFDHGIIARSYDLEGNPCYDRSQKGKVKGSAYSNDIVSLEYPEGNQLYEALPDDVENGTTSGQNVTTDKKIQPAKATTQL